MVAGCDEKGIQPELLDTTVRILKKPEDRNKLWASFRCDFTLFSRMSIPIGSFKVTSLPSAPSLSPVAFNFSRSRARISPSSLPFIKPSANQSLIPVQTESSAVCGL